MPVTLCCPPTSNNRRAQCNTAVIEAYVCVHTLRLTVYLVFQRKRTMLSVAVSSGGAALTSRRPHQLGLACPCSSGTLRSVIAQAKGSRKKQKKAAGGVRVGLRQWDSGNCTPSPPARSSDPSLSWQVQTASPEGAAVTEAGQSPPSSDAAGPRPLPAPAASAAAAPSSPVRATTPAPASTSGRPAVETPQASGHFTP